MTMKNLTLRRLIMAAMAGVALMAGCDKEERNQDNPLEKGLRLVAEQSLGGKTSVSGTSVLWADGDQVRINDVDCPLVVSNNGQHAEIDFDNSVTDIIVGYPASSVTNMSLANSTITIGLHGSYDYSVDANGRQHLALPMVGRAAAGESSVMLKHLCGMVSVTITNNTLFTIDLRRVLLRSSDRLTGTLSDLSLADMDNFSIDPQTSSNGTDNTVQVTFDDGSLPLESGASKVVAVPALPCRGFEVEVVFTQGSFPGLKAPPQYSYRRTSTRTLHRAEVLAAEVGINMASQYVAPSGGFLVNDAGDRVYFSQGNLRYNRIDRVWRFAANQYDVITDGNNWNDLYAGPTEIDLFGWGTSGWMLDENPFFSTWLSSPTTIVTDNTRYTPGGSAANSLIGSCAEADWAWHNPIANGGNQNHRWRTLTREEMRYIIDHHTYARAMINNVKGIILLPDGYQPPTMLPTGPNPTWTYVSLVNWRQWEADGGIFLPASGYRIGDHTEGASVSGFYIGQYWLSTCPEGFGEHAHAMRFNTFAFSIFNGERHYGCAVRPVIDASTILAHTAKSLYTAPY